MGAIWLKPGFGHFPEVSAGGSSSFCRKSFCSSFPLPSPSSEASWRSPERPRRAAPGLGQAAVRADCVSQKRVPRAQLRARPESGGAAGGLRGQLGRGRDELGRALLATRRSPAGGRGRRAGLGAAGPGLRVPPAASLVLSRLGRGEVKGWRGPGRGVGFGAVTGRLRVASILPPSGAGGQTGTMWRPKLSA